MAAPVTRVFRTQTSMMSALAFFAWRRIFVQAPPSESVTAQPIAVCPVTQAMVTRRSLAAGVNEAVVYVAAPVGDLVGDRRDDGGHLG